MRKLLFPLLCLVFIGFACSKDEAADTKNYGTDLNTWTFKEGPNTFNGSFLFDVASLNTNRVNDTHFFGMLGIESKKGYQFTINLSLSDLNFTKKTYQSGIDNDLMNAFYFTESPASIDNIYKSSNFDPGPVMTYTITSFDAVKDVVSFTFSGKAFDVNGRMVDITNGKVTVQIERY